MELDLVGAIKVKDGLFIGDEFAAQDLEFVVANKANFIINCAARQVPNHWEPIGVQYLSFYWLDAESQVLFDAKDDVLKRVFAFVEKAAAAGESVLIHSVRGQSRSACVVLAYLMKKYRWCYSKALQFLTRRRPDVRIKQNFAKQLKQVETRLAKQGTQPTSEWTEVSPDAVVAQEEMVLRNTYVNSQQEPEPPQDCPKNPQKRLCWTDNNSGNTAELTDLPPVKNPVEDGFALLKSCVKGSTAEQVRVPVPTAKPPRSRPAPVPRAKLANLDDLADSLHLDLLATGEEAKKASKKRSRPSSTEKRPNFLVRPNTQKGRAARKRT